MQGTQLSERSPTNTYGTSQFDGLRVRIQVHVSCYRYLIDVLGAHAAA